MPNAPAHTISPLLSVFDGSAPATAVTSVISTLSGVHSGHGKATHNGARRVPADSGQHRLAGLIRVRPDSLGSRLNRRDQASQLSIAGLKQKRPEAKASGRF